jgi:hypothetical protein
MFRVGLFTRGQLSEHGTACQKAVGKEDSLSAKIPYTVPKIHAVDSDTCVIIDPGGKAMPKKPNHDEILRAEFDYIAQTAFQANEDRARVSSFYFIAVGSIVATIFGAQFATDSLKGIAIPLFILFLAMTGLGALTIAQLARLRAAWHESAEAMNKIKDYYIKQDKEIESAFKWRVKSIPPTDKPYSIANLMAIEVALLSSLTSAAALYFLLLALGEIQWWGWIFVIAGLLVGYYAQWRWYKSLLVDNQ